MTALRDRKREGSERAKDFRVARREQTFAGGADCNSKTVKASVTVCSACVVQP